MDININLFTLVFNKWYYMLSIYHGTVLHDIAYITTNRPNRRAKDLFRELFLENDREISGTHCIPQNYPLMSLFPTFPRRSFDNKIRQCPWVIHGLHFRYLFVFNCHFGSKHVRY